MLIRSKKGSMEKEQILRTIIALVVISAVIAAVIMKYGPTWGIIKKISQPNITSEFGGFRASGIILSSDILTARNCTRFSDGIYTCRANQDISFEVDIINSGDRMYTLYGGISVCDVTCSRGICTPNDKECPEYITDTGTEKCSVQNNDVPYTCEAGSHKFSTGTYYVYPAVECPLTRDGCYGPGATRPIIDINNAKYLEIRVS